MSNVIRVERRTKRDIRRAFGPAAVDELATTIARVNELVAFAQRGFWGRMRWLFLGR
jgi:hypothetical protein